MGSRPASYRLMLSMTDRAAVSACVALATCELSSVQSGQEREVIELRAAPRMHERSALRQLRKQVAIQDPSRVLGERQQADENVGLTEHLAETGLAAIRCNSFDHLARAIPA